MDKELLNLPEAELQYCVTCPTCREKFNVNPAETPFVQKCVFCKHSFLVAAQKKAKEKNKAFALAG